nr:hypothetical protein [Tanacetum cinerariifolium]
MTPHHILYLIGLAGSWEEAPLQPVICVDVQGDYFSSTLVDLEEKAMIVGRSQALRYATILGVSWILEDMKDYELAAKKIYDQAVDAFYLAKFPNVKCSIRSLKELLTVELPTLPKGDANSTDHSISPFCRTFYLIFQVVLEWFIILGICLP